MYKYKFRPEYGGEHLLIEFISGPEKPEFMQDLFAAFSKLEFTAISLSDLWMNDEYLLGITSKAGNFELSKDIWDLVFITSKDNQAGLALLNNCLMKSDLFELIEVDFSQYK